MTQRSNQDDLPQVVKFPIENFSPRPMRPDERSLVVNLYWSLRREGVRLPAERGIIVIQGGRL